MCEELYNVIYAESIKAQLMNSLSKKRKGAPGTADVYALKKRLSVAVTFPVTPFMSNSELYVHYQRGLIPWETYVECAAKNTSLPVPDPIPPEPNTQTERDEIGTRSKPPKDEPLKDGDRKGDGEKEGADK